MPRSDCMTRMTRFPILFLAFFSWGVMENVSYVSFRNSEHPNEGEVWKQ